MEVGVGVGMSNNGTGGRHANETHEEGGEERVKDQIREETEKKEKKREVAR